ncbi:hypothetical protein RQM47_07930 [Rubrivirga sp. S365]|nr:hypothetical protein [Rubrivirga sp. S365]MDT7856565.1 hypothetical protein [Rubrivirga sp. S365]
MLLVPFSVLLVVIAAAAVVARPALRQPRRPYAWQTGQRYVARS